MPKVTLTGRQKIHKCFRLVALLTLRKYGSSILAQLYYAFLISAVVRAMDEIWTEFSDSQDCQYQFVTNVTSSMSEAYDEASRALATAALDNTKCIMQTIDVNMPSPLPDLPLSRLPDSVMLRLFGWISAPDIGLPAVQLQINNTADEVLADIHKDISKMSKVALWVDYAGFIMVGISILIILGTATYYTVRNKPWRPGKKRWFVVLIDIARILLFYILAVIVIFMQAYAMDHACAVRIEDTELSLPKCEIREECGFSCTIVPHVYENTCPECDIQLMWWWVDWNSLPNVVGVVYIVFVLLVWIMESVESRYQRRQVERAGRLKSIRAEMSRNALLNGGKRGQNPRSKGEDMRSPLLST